MILVIDLESRKISLLPSAIDPKKVFFEDPLPQCAVQYGFVETSGPDEGEVIAAMMDYDQSLEIRVNLKDSGTASFQVMGDGL
jgi:hypothetical protein